MCGSGPRDDTLPAPLPGLVVVAMSEADLDEVLAIENEAFRSPWRREHFAFEIRDNRFALNAVVRHGGQLVAYASTWQIHGELKVNNIAVHRDWRRHGLGRWLLRRLLDDAAMAGCNVARLEVRTSNAAAIGLYQAHGFAEVGRRRGYYRPEGEDAVLMEARLIPPPQ